MANPRYYWVQQGKRFVVIDGNTGKKLYSRGRQFDAEDDVRRMNAEPVVQENVKSFTPDMETPPSYLGASDACVLFDDFAIFEPTRSWHPPRQ